MVHQKVDEEVASNPCRDATDTINIEDENDSEASMSWEDAYDEDGRPYFLQEEQSPSPPTCCQDEEAATALEQQQQEQSTKRKLRWSDECGLELEHVVLVPARRRKSHCLQLLWHQNQQHSNARLLWTAFCTFMSFAIFQMAFAVHAQSQSLIGDSAIMIVDSFTYLFNWVAEVRKGMYDETLSRLARRRMKITEELQAIQKRTKRKIVLQMEIFPPIVSMMTLLVIVLFLLSKDIRILREGAADTAASKDVDVGVGAGGVDLDEGEDDDEEDDGPNIEIMARFSVFNLFLDVINVTCFARARHLLGFPSSSSGNKSTSYSSSSSGEETTSASGNSRSVNNNALNDKNNVDEEAALSRTLVAADRHTGNFEDEEEKLPEEDDNEQRDVPSVAGPDADPATATPPHRLRKRTNGRPNNNVASTKKTSNESSQDEEKKEHGPANLNIFSAFTHVFADTLRSIAVIIAAAVAKAAPNSVSPEIADASAALAVYLLIFVSIYPLLRGLRRLILEYRAILAQERAEAACEKFLVAAD